jgi:hypothetical protein
VHHGLLVPREVAGEPVLRLDQRLANTGDVPVTKNAEDAGEERLFDAVEARVLLGQEFNERLPHGKASGSFRLQAEVRSRGHGGSEADELPSGDRV